MKIANWRFDKLTYADQLDEDILVDELDKSGERLNSRAETLPDH